MVTIEYLEEERKKIWNKILILESDIDKKSGDHERDSKQSSRKCSEFRNRCEEARNESNILLQQIKDVYSFVEEKIEKIDGFSKYSQSKNEEISDVAGNIASMHEDIFDKCNHIEGNLVKLDEVFVKFPEIFEKLNKLSELIVKGDEYSSKIEGLYKNILTRKNEIDELYYEIVGYTEKDDKTGIESVVRGLRGDLEDSYDELEDKLSKFKIELDVEKNSASDKYKKLVDKGNDDIALFHEQWRAKLSNIESEIQGLMPKALTVGLSAAYSQKKKDEVEESIKLSTVFNKAIFGLVAVSVIPFLVSIVSLFQDKTLSQTIIEMPRLVLAILPLYIPVLWVAYSANRRMNLSKRLIEEYSHKEVLSKTFEGLARQIESVGDNVVGSDLKARLLFNMLEVSSENPGKLISDYNKSDHPLMDALDKSAKLSNAIDRLGKIPGIPKLITVLDRKSKSIIADESRKINAGLAVVDSPDVVQ